MIATMMLTVRNLTKSYRTSEEQLAVLRGVDLALAAGESVALTGESGSGKSTLLHLIAGLDKADSGEVWLDGALVSDLSDSDRAAMRRDRLGLVFQQFNLIPSLQVCDNLAFQARIAGRHDPAWQDELVKRLGLRTLLDRYPEQLSGGQQQRVAIGRALAIKPLVLLADEPTGNLDSANGEEIMDILMEVVEEGKATLVVVTHDTSLSTLGDRVLTIRDGVVVDD